MKVFNEVVNNYMTLEFKFPVIRFIDSILEPTAFTLNMNLTAVADARNPESFNHIQAEGSIAYQKIYFWLESVLPGILMVDCSENLGISLSSLVGNMMMHCPGPPIDEMVVRMIHSKLSTITNGKLIVGEMTLLADDSSTSFTFMPAEQGYYLPKTVKEYIDLPSLYKHPWWMRNDGFCFEFVKGKSVKDKLSDIYDGITDPLAEYEDSIRKATTGDDTPAKIIEHGTWKPKKI